MFKQIPFKLTLMTSHWNGIFNNKINTHFVLLLGSCMIKVKNEKEKLHVLNKLHINLQYTSSH